MRDLLHAVGLLGSGQQAPASFRCSFKPSFRPTKSIFDRGAAAANAIPSVIHDGVGDFLKHTGGPAGVADGAELTVVWEGEFQSDGSAMTLLDIPGTVPVKLIRNADNTIDFIGGTAGAVFSNSTAAVLASLGRLIVLASCNGTSSVLKVVHAAGTITGTNTPGTASNLSLVADWFLGSDGGTAEFLDAETGMWWSHNREIDFTDTNNIEQFWDTTNDKLRDPGADGSNPLDKSPVPLICHADNAANHTVNRGTGGDADAGSNSGDGVSPGAFAADYLAPLNAVAFDPANDTFLNGNLLADAESRYGIINFWFKRKSLATDQLIHDDSQDRILLFFNDSPADELTLRLADNANTSLLNYQGISSPQNDTVNWHHCIMSWDSQDFTVGGKFKCYIDGAVQAAPAFAADGNVDLNFGNNVIGRQSLNVRELDIDVAQFYMNFSETSYFDLTVKANRDKFYDAENSLPRALGADGAAPAGLGVPDHYLVRKAASYGRNGGSGGDWTANGTFADAGTNPGKPSAQP